MSASPATQRLRQVPLTDLASEQLNVLQEKATVKDALDIFSKKKISSVPIVDEDGDPWGSLDTLDLVAYLGRNMQPEWSGRPMGPDHIQAFLNAPVTDLLDLSARNAWRSIPKNRSVLKALRVLCMLGNHRVYLTDESGKPCGVVSQLEALSFILGNKDVFQNTLDKPVQEIWPEGRKVVGIRDSQDVLEAFRQIFIERVSGLAVLDDQGNIKGNISANDVRNINFNYDDPLKVVRLLHYTTLKDFISMKEKQDDVFVERTPTFKPVVIRRNDTLGSAMQKAMDHFVHRVYVVDDEGRLADVIAVGDMLAPFCR